MTKWQLARRDTSCGSCNANIRAGAAMVELQIGDTRRARCQDCGKGLAGEPPANLGAPVRSEPVFSRAPEFVSVGSLKPRDVKALQTGDRE